MKNKTKKLNSGKRNIKKAGSTRNNRKSILETIRSLNPFSRSSSNIQFSRVVPIETNHNVQNSAVSTLKMSRPQESLQPQQPRQTSKSSKTLQPNKRLLKYIEKKNEDAAIQIIREGQYTGNIFPLFHKAVINKMGETVLWFIIEEYKKKTKNEKSKNLITTFLDEYIKQYNEYRNNEEIQLGEFQKKIADININKNFIYDTITDFDKYDNIKNELIIENKPTSIENVLVDTRNIMESDFLKKSLHITELNETISIFKRKLQKIIMENAKEDNDYQMK